jgi:hypothetical protein
MEKAYPGHAPTVTWWFLAAAILLCGLLMASLLKGKIVVPGLGTVTRAEHPASFWVICAVQLFFTLAALWMHGRQFPIV